jgi:hypothetical protein
MKTKDRHWIGEAVSSCRVRFGYQTLWKDHFDITSAGELASGKSGSSVNDPAGIAGPSVILRVRQWLGRPSPRILR